MIEQLRQTCRQLLAEGKVDFILGYGRSSDRSPVHPVFVRKADQVDQLLWNDQCFHNLAAYLTRKEVRAMGRPGVVVKGCDEKAIVALVKESQLDRAQMVVIGVACGGLGQPKCDSCDVAMPRFADVTIGEAGAARTAAAQATSRYAALETFLARPAAQRMAYWQAEFARCVKCYACRQVCPMCYCERCIVDKNRPTCIDTSATLKGNFAWQVTRAFHQAARCVGCDECTRVCPAAIDLRLLNLSLAGAAERHFGYRSGMDPSVDPVIGAYSLQDKESFIQ